jgi:broad specificity phosphatase PhoE
VPPYPQWPDQIWLLRHGETEWSANLRHTGRTDVTLTPAGVLQAKQLARALGGRTFALVLTSALSRASETCRLAGYGDQAVVDEDLLEWDYGEYEGRTTLDIRRDNPGWTIWTGDPPGGESAEQVALRTKRVIDRLLTANGDVALFAHGHVLRILATTWLGLAPADGRLLALDTATLSVLGFEHETRVVRRWNAPVHEDV